MPVWECNPSEARKSSVIGRGKREMGRGTCEPLHSMSHSSFDFPVASSACKRIPAILRKVRQSACKTLSISAGALSALSDGSQNAIGHLLMIGKERASNKGCVQRQQCNIVDYSRACSSSCVGSNGLYVFHHGPALGSEDGERERTHMIGLSRTDATQVTSQSSGSHEKR